jgi:predicted metal-dependent phosphotriesterase family hydrolase
LNATLVDEHVVVGLQGHGFWGPARDHERAALGLRNLTAAGITRIVDTTTIECGRDAQILEAAAAASGIEILCCTGLSASAAGVSAAFRGLRAEHLADLFIAEISGAPHACAVILETGEDLDDFDERAGLAAAFAHAETGAPVLVRAHARNAVERVDRLKARGVDPERMVVLGLDAPATTWALLEALGKRGVLMGITSIADGGALGQDARAALLAFLTRRFGAARVVLGTGSALTRVGPESAEPEPGNAPFAQLRAQAETFGVDDAGFGALLDVDALLGPVAVAS